MRCFSLIFLFLCLCIIPAFSSESPDIIVHKGENLIALTIRNETSMPIDKLNIRIDEENAPDWIELSRTSVNVLSSNDEHGITLPLKVKDIAEGTRAVISLIIDDGSGSQWRAEVSVLVKNAAPQDYALLPNYPNPFNAETVIRYTLTEQSLTTLEIYNVMGQTVRVLVNESQSAGSHNVKWNGLDNEGKETASGVYFYRIKSGNFSKVRRMLFLK